MTRVGVLGLWHLGCVSASGWAALGHEVLAWDPDPALRNGVREGTAPLHEPGLDEALREALAQGTLRVCETAREVAGSCTVVQVAFDSEVDESGGVSDGRLDAAVAAFVESAHERSLLMVSSQVPLGTCARWMGRLPPGRRFAYVPENLRLGTAVADFAARRFTIVGVDDGDSWEEAAALLDGVGGDLRRMNVASAELCKHALNAYLGMSIAFANEVAWVARAAGADGQAVMGALRSDERVSPRSPLRPGGAFSGATLRRDLVALARAGRAAGRPELFETILSVNHRHASAGVDLLRTALGPLAGKEIAAIGLTYKAGTSTLRDSLPLRVVRTVAAEGAVVRAFDPLAEEVPDPPPNLTRASDLASCVAGADAVLLLNAVADAGALGAIVRLPRTALLVDAFGIEGVPLLEAAGWTYTGVAR